MIDFIVNYGPSILVGALLLFLVSAGLSYSLSKKEGDEQTLGGCARCGQRGGCSSYLANPDQADCGSEKENHTA